MAEKAGSEKSRSGVLHLKWAIVLGIIFFIVIGIISARSIHGILLKTGSSASSGQATSSQAH